MRAILINSYRCTVTDHLLPDPANTDPWECLTAMYAALSHERYRVDTIDSVRLDLENFLIVDGNGQVRHDPHARWFLLDGLHHETLAGNGLIIGAQGSDECDTTYQVADVDWRTYFFHAAGAHLIQTTAPWRPSR